MSWLSQTVMALSLMFLLPAPKAVAAANIIISPANTAGSFIISAPAGLQDVSAIDLSITYDKNVLSGPTVSAGAVTAGAMMESNTRTPGFLRIAFISVNPITAPAGNIATIMFANVGAPPIPKPSMTPKVYSSSGTQVAVDTNPTSNASITETVVSRVNGSCGTATSVLLSAAPVRNLCSNGAASSLSGTGPWFWSCLGANGGVSASCSAGLAPVVTANGTTHSSVSMGTLTYLDNKQQVDPKEAPKQESGHEGLPPNQQQDLPAPVAGIAAPAELPGISAEGKIAAGKKLSMLKAIVTPLQRFRDNKKSRSIKDLVQLFDTTSAREAGVSQIPAIAVADGKSQVVVAIDLADVDGVPIFSVNGANIKGIKQISGSTWELATVPQKGRYDIRLSVRTGSNVVDIPLVVTPSLDKKRINETQVITEKEVSAFLAKAGSSKTGTLPYDLNGDGIQDYQDDYILVAHHLMNVKKLDTLQKNKGRSN